jgi:hypothetical protein
MAASKSQEEHQQQWKEEMTKMVKNTPNHKMIKVTSGTIEYVEKAEDGSAAGVCFYSRRYDEDSTIYVQFTCGDCVWFMINSDEYGSIARYSDFARLPVACPCHRCKRDLRKAKLIKKTTLH